MFHFYRVLISQIHQLILVFAQVHLVDCVPALSWTSYLSICSRIPLKSLLTRYWPTTWNYAFSWRSTAPAIDLMSPFWSHKKLLSNYRSSLFIWWLLFRILRIPNEFVSLTFECFVASACFSCCRASCCASPRWKCCSFVFLCLCFGRRCHLLRVSFGMSASFWCLFPPARALNERCFYRIYAKSGFFGCWKSCSRAKVCWTMFEL